MSEPDLGALLGSLSDGDVELLKQTAAGLLAGLGKSETTAPVGMAPALTDLSLLTKLTPYLEKLSGRDERVDFLMALKPLLSEERRHKADEAARIVRLLALLPVLKERGLP
jgi:hypothetical protein